MLELISYGICALLLVQSFTFIESEKKSQQFGAVVAVITAVMLFTLTLTQAHALRKAQAPNTDYSEPAEDFSVGNILVEP